MADKKNIGRATMAWRPGPDGNAPLGYWPQHLQRNGGGWTSQAWGAYSQALQIAQKYHDQNHAINLAASQPNGPQPDLGDIGARHQSASLDMKRIEGLVGKMALISEQVSQKQAALKAVEYSPTDMPAPLLRQERRSRLASMPDDKRMQALRELPYREAMLEAPDLSGVSPTYAAAIEREILEQKYPGALSGIKEAQEAIETLSTVLETT